MSELTFESAQREPEQIVERLERGEAELDEAIALWERGEELLRFCLTRPETAEGRIEESPSAPPGPHRFLPQASQVRIASWRARRPRCVVSRSALLRTREARSLERIADSFKQRDYSAGDTIASEGSGGAGFFVIGEGTAKVTVHGDDRATLGPGDYFGEIALIDEGARTATVTAETDMTTYAMTFWEFRPIVETDARIAWKLVQALAHRPREADAR